MHCDLCGKETNEIYKAEIEGSVFNVCRDCASLGRVLSKVSTNTKKNIIRKTKKPVVEKEIVEVIVPNYAKLIKTAREKLGLKQEELAKKLAVKDSLIHAIESGRHEPSIELAKKLEHFLGIHLVEEQVFETVPKKMGSKKENDEVTLGDIIKIRKR
ncbi:MAG: putative transcription factor [Candidatus Woesearchaeota archaeon]|nr:putative transcription factor [Candidatus Woesearchaeota archaeon]MDN5327788.1 putative transcription factor [Candidatus Woesearchaeota archaeon]